MANFRNPEPDVRTCGRFPWVGSYVPAKVLTNADLGPWWRPRTNGSRPGREFASVGSRRLKRPRRTYGHRAARRALASSGIRAEEVDLIIVATITPTCSFSTGVPGAAQLGGGPGGGI